MALPFAAGLALAAPLALPSGPGASAPHLASEGDGVRLTWFEPQGAGGHALRTAVRDRSGTWTTPARIAASDAFFVNWADTPSVVRGGDGRWVAHFATRSGDAPYAYDVTLARSTDGVAWTAVSTAHDDDDTQTEHGFVSTWPSADGVGLLWLDGRATATGGPMALRTAALTTAVGPSTVVDARVCDCCGTDVALTPDGVPVAVWRDRTDAELRDIRAARLDGSDPVAVGDDGWQLGGCPVNGPRIVATGDHLIAVWTTGAGGPLSVRGAVSEDGGRSFGPAVVLADATSAPLGRVDLVALAEGAALSVLHDLGGGEAEVRVRHLRVEGGSLLTGAPTRLGGADAARGAGFPRMAAVPGRLLAVWTDPDSGLVGAELRLADLPAAERRAVATSAAPTPEARPTRRPGLRGTTPVGTPWDLVDVEGPAMVALWATWCGPCRRELPALDALARSSGMAVVAVAVDDDPDKVRALTAGLALQVALTTTDAARAAFGPFTVPTTHLFAADGSRVWSHTGTVDAASLTEAARHLDP